MSTGELIRRMPAIIAKAQTEMSRSVIHGEITLTARAIRGAAVDCGYTDGISNHDLATAMHAVGAVRGTNSSTGGARYRFKGAFTCADAIAMAVRNVGNPED